MPLNIPAGHPVSYYAAYFEKIKKGLGAEYLKFARNNSDVSPFQAAQAFEVKIALQATGSGIAQGLGGGARSFNQAIKGTGQSIAQTASSWSSGLGGMIGSGIETGFIGIIKDLWVVVKGPLLVIAGITVALITLLIFFKDDIMAAAKVVGMAAA